MAADQRIPWHAHHLAERYGLLVIIALGEGLLGTVAVPLASYVLGVFVLYTLLTHSFDPFHMVLLAVTAAVLVAGVLMARADVRLEWCLLVLSATPWVTVVGYETIGHRHNEAVLAAG